MTKTNDQITNLDAELDALSSPTTADTYVVSKDYDPDVVAASAARRSLGGGGGGGGAQTLLALVSLAHSADFMNLNTSVVVAAADAGVSGYVALTLAPSAFANGAGVKLRVSNGSGVALLVTGQLLVQSADGTDWLERDTSAPIEVAVDDSVDLDLASSGGSGGSGLSWDSGTKRIIIASAGAYSATAYATAIAAA